MYSQASASVRTFFSKTDSSETFASFDLSLISYFLFLLIFQNSGIQPEAPVQGLERAQPNISTTAGTQPSAWPHRGDKWCPRYSRSRAVAGPWGCVLPQHEWTMRLLCVKSTEDAGQVARGRVPKQTANSYSPACFSPT